MLNITEETTTVPRDGSLLESLGAIRRDGLLRVVVEQEIEHGYDVGVLRMVGEPLPDLHDPLRFVRRLVHDDREFVAAMVVPAGIGAAVGGHAGDATPAARVLAAACDWLILHPNVVNASDVNEMPANALYVEGSVFAQVMMGTCGLRRVRSNRVLLAVDEGAPGPVRDVAHNTAAAARATLGMRVDSVEVPLPCLRAGWSDSGRAVGAIQNFERLLKRVGTDDYDALAVTSPVHLDGDHDEIAGAYFKNGGVNPWGGVEAMLTHAVSSVLGVPCAHAPMVSDENHWHLDVGRPSDRMAAEVISMGYLFSVLKGLHRAPRIEASLYGTMGVREISALVTPERCLGLPVIAARLQGIPVVVVRDQENVMKNSQPRPTVRNYLEAAGVLLAMREGMAT